MMVLGVLLKIQILSLTSNLLSQNLQECCNRICILASVPGDFYANRGKKNTSLTSSVKTIYHLYQVGIQKND